MLMIRLSRIGKKKHPHFRLIVSEKARDTVGTYVEQVGTYDPHANQATLNAERIKYWISKGAQPSGTVHNLLVDQKIIDAPKLKVANIKKKAEAEKPAEKKEAPAAEAAAEKKETAPATPAA